MLHREKFLAELAVTGSLKLHISLRLSVTTPYEMATVIRKNASKMKTILIALDENETAAKMAEIGYGLAKSLNARTVLLHVISDTTYYSSLNYSPIVGFGYGSNAVQTDTVELVKALAKNYLDQFRQELGDEKIETVVETGDFAEMILHTAKRLNVDIIVMGTHGRHGLQKILLESAAEKVLNDSLIPLFIIPRKALSGGK